MFEMIDSEHMYGEISLHIDACTPPQPCLALSRSHILTQMKCQLNYALRLQRWVLPVTILYTIHISPVNLILCMKIVDEDDDENEESEVDNG